MKHTIVIECWLSNLSKGDVSVYVCERERARANHGYVIVQDFTEPVVCLVFMMADMFIPKCSKQISVEIQGPEQR